jgi:hypothetical protein
MEQHEEVLKYYHQCFDQSKPEKGTIISHFVHKNDEFCIYTPKDSKVSYVIVRGSNDIKDWINNLKYSSTDLIHEGFADSAQWIHTILSRIYSKVQYYFFVGYSRGGAIACLLGKLFYEAYPEQYAGCTTFGQPRIAKENFVLPNYTRVYYQNDIITKLPKKFKHIDHKSIILKSQWWHWIPSLYVKLKVHQLY